MKKAGKHYASIFILIHIYPCLYNCKSAVNMSDDILMFISCAKGTYNLYVYRNIRGEMQKQ